MTLFAIFGLGPMEIAVVAILGVLLFGKKLPDIGRSLGKTMTEFKRGVNGLEEGLDAPGVAPSEGVAQSVRPPQRVAATAPKFEEATPGV